MDEDKIIYGKRGKEFEEMIKSVIEKSGVKRYYIDKLIGKKAMELFDIVFTHKTADPVNNYEFLEIMGDATAAKFLVWYYAKRFPQLNCAAGVDIIARLKIVYGSKIMMSRLATRMKFNMSYVTIRESEKLKTTSTLEDIAEAFIGAVEIIFNANYDIGIGYNAIYYMLKWYMDSEYISLQYEVLVDPKTRLYHLVDHIKKNYNIREMAIDFNFVRKKDDGKVDGEIYIGTNNDYFNNKYGLESIKVIKTMKAIKNSKDFKDIKEIKDFKRLKKFEGLETLKPPIGTGRAFTQKEVEQQMSKQMLAYMKARGIHRETPENYRKLCGDTSMSDRFQDLKI